MNSRNIYFSVLLSLSLTLCICPGCAEDPADMQKLVISENHRFLVREDGTPFVWIGETNWFFSQLPPGTIDRILDKRKAQGYTIMFVSCRQELFSGEGRPGPVENPNEAWWAYLDEYIGKCESRGLYVGITLGWWGKAMQMDPEELYRYGKWVGNRYRDRNNIVWLTLGEAGSHQRRNTIPDEKLNALIDGIREGDTGNKLLTVHADYRRGTSLSNDGEISDFNNWQTSQWGSVNDLPRKDEREWTVWEAIEHDYSLMYDGDPKPTLDAEAWYEHNKDFCGASAFNIRRRAYFTIFAGAFGHTYGAGGIWDGLNEPVGCSGSALEALDYPGAGDIGHLSTLLHALGKDFLRLRPRQDLIVSENSDSYDRHIQACADGESEFALIYSASDGEYEIDMSKLLTRKPYALWFNPGNGEIESYHLLGVAPVDGRDHRIMDPPGDSGPGNDWVLVIGRKSFLRQLKEKMENPGFLDE